MNRVSLWLDFLTNDKRVIHKGKHYFPAYERHFKTIPQYGCLLFEIGCGRGGSLQMCKRYFGRMRKLSGSILMRRQRSFPKTRLKHASATSGQKIWQRW